MKIITIEELPLWLDICCYMAIIAYGAVIDYKLPEDFQLWYSERAKKQGFSEDIIKSVMTQIENTMDGLREEFEQCQNEKKVSRLKGMSVGASRRGDTNTLTRR